MIGRVWHGWTTHANADVFEAVVRNEILPTMLSKEMPGFRDIQLMRLVRAGHTEFATLMRFDDMEAVRAFAGEDYTRAVVAPKARDLLRRFDARVNHYEVREIRSA